jgi:hypothetical protein
MFGKLLLHSPAQLMRYAIVLAAIMMLLPGLFMLMGALGFIFLPVAIIVIPFIVWTFFGEGQKEHEADVRRHEYDRQYAAHEHAHAHA